MHWGKKRACWALAEENGGTRSVEISVSVSYSIRTSNLSFVPFLLRWATISCFCLTCISRLEKSLCEIQTKKKKKSLLLISKEHPGARDANKAKSLITVMLSSCLPRDRDLNRCYLSSHLSTCPNKNPPGYWRQVNWNARVGAVTDDHAA